MSFVSLLFYPCLLAAGVGFYALPARMRALYLLALSLDFYALSSPEGVALLLTVTVLIYWMGLKIADTESEREKALYLYLGVGAVGGLMIGFKFAGAFHGVLLPLGLSYYSFKLISYIIEVYWDEATVEKDLVLFALYPAFFPQIVSGPIQRPGAFFEQMRAAVSRPADNDRIEQGFRLILGGLMLKLLVGDRLGTFIDIVDKSPTDYSFAVILVTILCYTLHLYADFAGYTNIAIGVGKIFGIDAPPNFNAPFAAPNIQQMWQRWHMSLTSWVTDYLFTPLIMALRHMGKAGLVLCITINMVVIGLWHGLTLNFLAFGLCHALFVVVTALTLRFRDKLFGKSKVVHAVRMVSGILLTFALMSFSQIFWHTGAWDAAVTHVKILFGFTPAGRLGFDDIRTDAVEPLFVCMALAFYIGLGAPGMKWIGESVDRFTPNWVQYGFYLLLISALTTESGISFVYGQF